MNLEGQRKVLNLLKLAKDFTYQFETLVPLYLGATIKHKLVDGTMEARAAASMLDQAARAKIFREEIEALILKAMRDGELIL